MISWLPAAHVAERAAHYYLPIVYAMSVTCCPDPRRIGEWLPKVRPTWFFAVPRVWEKMKAGIEAKLAGDEGAQKLLAAGRQRVELEQAGQPIPEQLAAVLQLGEEKLFAPLRAAIGLDEAKLANVGAAPTPREVLVFFHAIGVPLAEIWGMSETCGAGASNPIEKIKIGTVGLPSPGVELKLAEDGELLARSQVVMVGYRNLPERTAEALDDDGWLHTGDVATIDEDGYVTIVDRKKELIINAAGKNMSPANIEAALKGASPLIGQACVIGDGRAYNTALLVLDPDYARGCHGRRRERRRPGGGRRRQCDAVAPGADQALHGPRGRLAPRRRRADADDEAQAPPGRREVRGRDRGDVRQRHRGRITAGRAMSPRPAGTTLLRAPRGRRD